jgi:hypothetical protein
MLCYWSVVEAISAMRIKRASSPEKNKGMRACVSLFLHAASRKAAENGSRDKIGACLNEPVQIVALFLEKIVPSSFPSCQGNGPGSRSDGKETIKTEQMLLTKAYPPDLFG